MSADDFQTKYCSVMEGMLKSAVAETTKLFQTMVDELKTEISNIKKENEDLKTRCSQFENASSQEAVSSRESEPHLGRSHGAEQRDTAVQCEPVPFRTMLVEQYQTLRDSSLQNPEPQCEHEDISYTLQEHNYVTNAKDNPQKAYILVKQEQSVLTDKEVEPTVVYGQVLNDKAGSSLAFACEIVNEDPLINPELSTEGIPLPQRHEENTVALELPCLGMDSKEEQFAQPTAIKNREALDELQNDVPKGEAISQPDLSARRRRGRPAKKVKHLQQPVKEIIKSASNLKNSPMKKVEEVEVLSPAGTVNTVVDRIKYPLSVTVESLRSRSSKKEKTSKSLQLSKKIQLSKEVTIKTPSTSVSFETETLKTPTSESVQPRKRHTSVTLQDAMLLVEAMNQSTEKNTLSSPQRMEAAHQTQWASCVGTLETVDPVTAEPQTPLLPVKIPEASGNVPVSELSTTEQLTKQELSAATKTSDVPPNSGSLAHIKAVIPKDHHTVTNTSAKPSSTTATQTSVHSFKQHYPNPLIPSVAPSKRGNTVPHNVSVSASVSSLIPHKTTAIPPTQLPSVLSTVVAAHKNGDLPAIPSTATGLNLGIPFLSSTFQKTIQVRPMKTIPVVSSQWTTNSNDPQPGKLQLPKVTIIIPRRVSAVALRKHQAPAIVLTTKQEAASPVKVSSSLLISSSKELSTSRDEQTTLAEVVPMSSQTWDNAADNLRPVNQTPSVSETKNEPIETCSTLPVSVGLVPSPMIQAVPLTAVVRLTRLPFQISPKESVSVSAVPTYKPSESQSILKAGTTQENPSTLVVSTQPLEMLGITTDISSNSKETSVAVSVNTLISEGTNGNQEKASVSSENVLAKLPDSGYVHPSKPSNMSALVFENSTLAFNTTNPPTVSAMADPTSNVDEEIVSLSVQDGAIPNDPPIEEKKTASVIHLTSITSKATLETLSQMSKTQFLAQLAVTPVVQDRIKYGQVADREEIFKQRTSILQNVYSNGSVGAKASCAETSTSDKKRLQKGTLVTKLRSHVKTHLQVGRTERNREALAEIEPPPVSPKKPRSEENSPNEENTTGVSPKTQGEAKDVTCPRQTGNQPTLISPRRSGLCKNGVTSSRTFNPTSASIRRSNGTSESTPLNLRSSRSDSGGGGIKIKKSTSVRTMRSSSSKESVRPNETKITSVSPRRSSLSKESVVPQKTKNTTVHAQRFSARGSASPKITKTGTSPNNTKTITVRPKRTASPKKIKRTSDRISGLGKNGPSPKMSTNELTSGSHRCSLSKFSSPKSCSITSDGASTKNSNRSSLVVRGPKLDKDGVSPRKTRESTPAKKPKLCQDGTSRLKNNSRVANATKLAIAAKAQITAKLRNAKQTKLQNGAKTSQLPGTSTSSPAAKRCIAKAVWTPPKVTVNKVSPARGKGSSPFPVKKERKSPRSQKPTVVFPPSVSLYPIPVRAPPIVSPLQPLSVIGWRLLKNQCGECGRVFSGSAALKRHVSLHKVRRPFSCTLCGKHFPDSKCLKRHGRVHRNGRIHVCQQCGKGFVYTFGLTKHIQTVHLKKKPFICKFCNKGFFTKRDMENHIRIHTGEKPFHCNLCERKFTRRVELNVHLRWHNGEKRHWCPYCGKGFLDYNNLKRHKYIHTGEKPESCPHCPKNFTQSGHLKKHVRNVHKIQ